VGFTHPPIECVLWIVSCPELENSATSVYDAKNAPIYNLTPPDILIA
jgi:hypothetical protein